MQLLQKWEEISRESIDEAQMTDNYHDIFLLVLENLSLSFQAGNPEEDIVADSISYVSRRKQKKSSGVVKTFLINFVEKWLFLSHGRIIIQIFSSDQTIRST